MLGKQLDSSPSVVHYDRARTCDPVIGGESDPLALAAWPLQQVVFWTKGTPPGIQNLDGTDGNLGNRGAHCEARADLAGMGAHLDIAAEQSSFITNADLDALAVLASRKAHAWLITRCEGKALSLVSLVPRRQGLEAWRVLKDEYEERGGNRVAIPSSSREKCSEGRVALATSILGKRRGPVQDRRKGRSPTGGSGGKHDGTRASSLP